jgi:hypothetical protein
LIESGGRVEVLKIRTMLGMVSLNDQEAAELRDRLRRLPAAQPAEETIAVSVNASTSVTFTETEKTAVVDVLTNWLAELGSAGIGSGPAELREGLPASLSTEQGRSIIKEPRLVRAARWRCRGRPAELRLPGA